MTLHLKLNMDNAAFEDSKREETARILTKLAESIATGGHSEKLKDINGNTCGTIAYSKN